MEVYQYIQITYWTCYPCSFASSTSYDEGVEEVNWTDDVIVDSVTMAHASISPDLIVYVFF